MSDACGAVLPIYESRLSKCSVQNAASPARRQSYTQVRFLEFQLETSSVPKLLYTPTAPINPKENGTHIMQSEMDSSLSQARAVSQSLATRKRILFCASAYRNWFSGRGKRPLPVLGLLVSLFLLQPFASCDTPTSAVPSFQAKSAMSIADRSLHSA